MLIFFNEPIQNQTIGCWSVKNVSLPRNYKNVQYNDTIVG